MNHWRQQQLMGASAKMVKEAEFKKEPIVSNKQNVRKNPPTPAKKKVKSIARASDQMLKL